jgi:hypothetical protein
MGLVSGPFGLGDQVADPSHRERLWSKAMVVSVADTWGDDACARCALQRVSATPRCAWPRHARPPVRAPRRPHKRGPRWCALSGALSVQAWIFARPFLAGCSFLGSSFANLALSASICSALGNRLPRARTMGVLILCHTRRTLRLSRSPNHPAIITGGKGSAGLVPIGFSACLILSRPRCG